MPTFEITSPEGKKYRVTAPEGSTREQALEKVKAQIGSASQPTQDNYDPSEGGGTLNFAGFDTGIKTPQGVDRFLSGFGKFMVDTARGGEQLVRSAIPGESDREKQLQEEIDQSRSLDQPLMSTGSGIAGNIVGGVATLAPAAMLATSAVPAAAGGYTAAALGGAGAGALQPVAEGESRLVNTTVGAVGGTVGRGITGGVSRLFNPQTRKAAADLIRQGTTPTPGQILGGIYQRTEDALTSLPIAGDFIKAGQRRAITDFNKTALNRVLNPIGKTVKKVGREGIEEAQDAVSKAYDDILPKLTAQVDDIFKTDLKHIVDAASELSETQKKRLLEIVSTKINRHVTGKNLLNGETLKRIDSELGRLGSGYSKSLDVDVQDLGSVVNTLKVSFRELVKRQNPESIALRNADEAFANLLRVQRAAGATGAAEGVFTPAQLANAVKAMDNSLRKKAFSSGNALMQDLAESGKSVLSQTVPDSGTPYRVANLGAVVAGGVHPAIPLGLASTGAVYNPLSQRLAAALLTKRPEVMRAVGTGISKLNPYASAIMSASGPVVAQQQGNP
jgi:hypothetical protein